MHCPKCNNTNWVIAEHRSFMDRLAILRLKRPYQCIKCERIRLGWVFLRLLSHATVSHSRPSDAKWDELKCPECGGDVRRSHRRTIDRMLFFLTPYRCLECRTRFRIVKGRYNSRRANP
jgi:hypothetical protein